MAILRQADIAARLREIDAPAELAELAAPCTRLVAHAVSSDDLPLGASRLGGQPDLPPDAVWPEHDGRPLAFLAQLDLSELAMPDLPATGQLFFFYDAERQPWGSDHRDRGGAAVLYADVGREELRRTGTFDTTRVDVSRRLVLPYLSDDVVLDAGYQVEFEPYREGYQALTEEVFGREPNHQVLGHPQFIQGDQRMTCHNAHHGITRPAPSQDAAPRNPFGPIWLLPFRLIWTALRPQPPVETQQERDERRAASDWRLLLQLDTDPVPGWMWGGSGRLFFWIRNADLRERTFANIWCVLECT